MALENLLSRWSNHAVSMRHSKNQHVGKICFTSERIVVLDEATRARDHHWLWYHQWGHCPGSLESESLISWLGLKTCQLPSAAPYRNSNRWFTWNSIESPTVGLLNVCQRLKWDASIRLFTLGATSLVYAVTQESVVQSPLKIRKVAVNTLFHHKTLLIAS